MVEISGELRLSIGLLLKGEKRFELRERKRGRKRVADCEGSSGCSRDSGELEGWRGKDSLVSYSSERMEEESVFQIPLV